MLRLILMAAVVAIGAAAGCKRNTYRVDLKPVADGLERSLRIERGPLRAADDVAVDRVSTFAGATPADIGGAGSYTTYSTSLGTLHVYLERFRGDDDLIGQWERQAGAIDTFVDLLLTWIDASLAAERGFDKLRSWADRDLRRDLKNSALYVHVASEQARSRLDMVPDSERDKHLTEAALAEFAARMAQYACERGYISAGQVPEVVRAFEIYEDDQGRAVMALVRRQVLRRMGRDEGDPTFAPPALTDGPAWNAALSAHLRESASARDRLAAWGRTAGLGGEDGEMTLQQLGPAAVRIPLFMPLDQLALSLVCAERPFSTNGTWDDAGRRVTWAGMMDLEKKDAVGTPLLAYAAWSVPDAEAQTKRLGSAALRDASLASYCLWRNGLSAAEAAEWERFLESVTPGETLASQLRGFRFANQADATQSPSGPAAIAEVFSIPVR